MTSLVPESLESGKPKGFRASIGNIVHKCLPGKPKDSPKLERVSHVGEERTGELFLPPHAFAQPTVEPLPLETGEEQTPAEVMTHQAETLRKDIGTTLPFAVVPPADVSAVHQAAEERGRATTPALTTRQLVERIQASEVRTVNVPSALADVPALGLEVNLSEPWNEGTTRTSIPTSRPPMTQEVIGDPGRRSPERLLSEDHEDVAASTIETQQVAVSERTTQQPVQVPGVLNNAELSPARPDVQIDVETDRTPHSVQPVTPEPASEREHTQNQLVLHQLSSSAEPERAVEFNRGAMGERPASSQLTTPLVQPEPLEVIEKNTQVQSMTPGVGVVPKMHTQLEDQGQHTPVETGLKPKGGSAQLPVNVLSVPDAQVEPSAEGEHTEGRLDVDPLITSSETEQGVTSTEGVTGERPASSELSVSNGDSLPPVESAEGSGANTHAQTMMPGVGDVPTTYAQLEDHVHRSVVETLAKSESSKLPGIVPSAPDVQHPVISPEVEQVVESAEAVAREHPISSHTGTPQPRSVEVIKTNTQVQSTTPGAGDAPRMHNQFEDEVHQASPLSDAQQGLTSDNRDSEQAVVHEAPTPEETVTGEEVQGASAQALIVETPDVLPDPKLEAQSDIARAFSLPRDEESVPPTSSPLTPERSDQIVASAVPVASGVGHLQRNPQADKHAQLEKLYTAAPGSRPTLHDLSEAVRLFKVLYDQLGDQVIAGNYSDEARAEKDRLEDHLMALMESAYMQPPEIQQWLLAQLEPVDRGMQNIIRDFKMNA